MHCLSLKAYIPMGFTEITATLMATNICYAIVNKITLWKSCISMELLFTVAIINWML